MASFRDRCRAAGRVAALLVSAFAVLCAVGAVVRVHAASGGTALTSHVVNLTLSGAGTGSNWPSTSEALANVTSAVNSTVCGDLPSGISSCNAFLMRVSETQLGLQVSVNTLTAANGNATYTILSDWVDSSGTTVSALLTAVTTACATALGTSLTSLTFSAGVYVVPCRAPLTYAYLPSCATDETAVTTAYILSPSTSVSSYFTTYLCGSAPTSTCSSSVAVTAPSGTQLYTIVDITSQPLALEAVLSYVADVRAGYTGTSQVLGTAVGSTSAGVTAQSVELRYRGMHATLFSKAENNRTYSSTTRVTYACEASAGYWAFALIAVLPLGAILFRYVWYRGRHRAKKQERARVVADETRIMQGYTNPADAQQGGAAGPPPGVDTSANGAGAATAQWVMDENGNYYDANAAGYETAEASTGRGGGGADTTTQAYAAASADGAPAYQTYVDPNTGETYQYIVNETQADEQAQGGDAAQQQEEQQPTDDAAAAAAADGQGYQTYVDPNTCETYQYVTEEAAAGADGYQTYVDPTTGETYQYMDPSAAAAGGSQYVDPNTGEAYQYVDPETGETYTYAAAAGEGDAAENADDGTGAEGYDDADAAAAVGNVYVDPNTGETYQYVVPSEQ